MEVGTAASVAALSGCAAALVFKLDAVKGKSQQTTRNITLVNNRLHEVKTSLEAINRLLVARSESNRPFERLDEQLKTTLKSCALIVHLIEQRLDSTDLVNSSAIDKSHLIHLDAGLGEFRSCSIAQTEALRLLLAIYQWYLF
jgi:hypothetical protein